MKFGVREICNVVLKKKAEGKFGRLWLDKDAPVIYFDTLKTSSLEGAATTVYAQGGRGNPRLIAWEGDRTITFTMEDALISPESFSVLSGAGLINASENEPIYIHTTEMVEVKGGQIQLSKIPATEDVKSGCECYIMVTTADGVIDPAYLPMKIHPSKVAQTMSLNPSSGVLADWATKYNEDPRHAQLISAGVIPEATVPAIADGYVVYVDYYIQAKESVRQINIEAAKFGGSYYLEASTLFRDQATGDDYPAEFVIPNCKVQSNFTFTLSPTGDPSTFTFTMDAFPDYTKFDKTKKVIAAIQIIEDEALVGRKNN